MLLTAQIGHQSLTFILTSSDEALVEKVFDSPQRQFFPIFGQQVTSVE